MNLRHELCWMVMVMAMMKTAGMMLVVLVVAVGG
jgi:hypothetical protein